VPKSLFTQKYDQFRALLIAARKKSGLTQTELARKLSRPQSFVSKFERGERRLDLIEFIQVAEALGADAHKLLRAVQQDEPVHSRRSGRS